MKVLGIDPGVERLGFGVIVVEQGRQHLVEYGVITTPRDQTLPQRLCMIQEDLQAILRKHPDIERVGVEELFFAKNAKTAFMVGQARGVILLTLAQAGLRPVEVKPVEVKMALTGSGRADKKAMQKMIQLSFQLHTPPEPDDAADAIAVAITAASIQLA